MVPVTPETVAATYTWLLNFPPFNRWKLPPATKITFGVVDFKTEVAEFDYRKMQLRVSTANVGTYEMLIKALCHEMIHVREHVAGKWTQKHDSAFFLKCKAMVCKHFGFDPLIF